MMTEIQVEPVKNYKKYATIENAAKLLVFLLPIGAASIKGWSSAFYGFLAIVSVVWLIKKADFKSLRICKEEKIILWLFALFFLSFIFSETMNGWIGIKSRWVFLELRYLLFVPIYLMLRNINNIGYVLIKSCVVTGFVLAFHSCYDLLVLEIPRATGVYHHLYFGGVSTVCLFALLSAEVYGWTSKYWRIAGSISIFLCLFSVIASTSRGSYVAVSFLFLLYPFFNKKITVRTIVVSWMLLIVFSLLLYSNSELVKQRVDLGFKQLSDYIQADKDQIHDYEIIGSVGVRFEFGKAAILMFMDKPLSGVGRTGFAREVKKLMANGRASRAIGSFADPHNAFFYVLASKGFFGIIIFLSIVGLLFYSFFVNWRLTKNIAPKVGLMFVIGFVIVSLTESASIHRGHWLSFNLLFFVVLYSWRNQSRMIR